MSRACHPLRRSVLCEPFNVTAIPATYLIDRTGRIAATYGLRGEPNDLHFTPLEGPWPFGTISAGIPSRPDGRSRRETPGTTGRYRVSDSQT
jgi:hypothetical protein